MKLFHLPFSPRSLLSRWRGPRIPLGWIGLGLLAFAAAGRVLADVPALNWVQTVSGTNQVLRGATFGANRFVVVGVAP